MKINNKPTPLSPERIKNDTEFWNWYCDRLINDQKFIRDIVARKTFSKLRSALAGLYVARGKPKEAEAAFQQAIALYDLSPEAHFRLADLISRQGRFDEAISLFNILLEKDPNNEKAAEFLMHLKRMKIVVTKRLVLEKKIKSNNIKFTDAIDLISIYFQMNQLQQADALATHMLSSNTMDSNMVFQLAQYMAKNKRFKVTELALKKYTRMKPNDSKGWMNLAALQLVLNQHTEMWASLNKAIENGGELTRNLLRKDARFNTIRQTRAFQKMVPNRKPIGITPLSGLL